MLSKPGKWKCELEPHFLWSLWGHNIEGWGKLQDSYSLLGNRLFSFFFNYPIFFLLFSFNSSDLVSQSVNFFLELSTAKYLSSNSKTGLWKWFHRIRILQLEGTIKIKIQSPCFREWQIYLFIHSLFHSFQKYFLGT